MNHPGPDRPMGVRLLIWTFAFWAGAIAMVLLGLGLGEGYVVLGGETVTRGEALATVTPVLLPMGLAVAGAALALGLGRSWARPAALFPFIIAAFTPTLSRLRASGPAELGAALAVLAPVLAVLVWYLYFRPRSRAYFDQLRERRAEEQAEREEREWRGRG